MDEAQTIPLTPDPKVWPTPIHQATRERDRLRMRKALLNLLPRPQLEALIGFKDRPWLMSLDECREKILRDWSGSTWTNIGYYIHSIVTKD